MGRDFVMVTYNSSPGPSASQIAIRGCVDPLFSVPIVGQEPFLDSLQSAKSHGIPNDPSRLRVEVTGMYLKSDTLIPR